MSSGVGAGYRLIETAPPVRDYLLLRERAGLSPKSIEQGSAGLPGSWAACHVVHDPTECCVAMGREIGDGGWYFHIIDMAVLPEHQRRGLGRAVLTSLIDRIHAQAPRGATINLLADPPRRPLSARHGFVETAPASIGMTLPRDPS